MMNPNLDLEKAFNDLEKEFYINLKRHTENIKGKSFKRGDFSFIYPLELRCVYESYFKAYCETESYDLFDHPLTCAIWGTDTYNEMIEQIKLLNEDWDKYVKDYTGNLLT